MRTCKVGPFPNHERPVLSEFLNVCERANSPVCRIRGHYLLQAISPDRDSFVTHFRRGFDSLGEILDEYLLKEAASRYGEIIGRAATTERELVVAVLVEVKASGKGNAGRALAT